MYLTHLIINIHKHHTSSTFTPLSVLLQATLLVSFFSSGVSNLCPLSPPFLSCLGEKGLVCSTLSPPQVHVGILGMKCQSGQIPEQTAMLPWPKISAATLKFYPAPLSLVSPTDEMVWTHESAV